jgi:uncharacterized protein YdeI (YjbR/CyaY-like superfamily)
MPKKDKRVDAYIAKAAPFAQPILKHLRALMHEACPAVEETIKWNTPHYMHQGMMCATAAFKGHCHLGFWKGELIFAEEKGKDGASAREKLREITSLADLPGDDVLRGYFRQAAALNEAGVKVPAPKRSAEKKELVVPEFLLTALQKNKKALAAFEAFSYSHKKEYVEWVAEAKREETRQKRIETMMKWLVEGKSRHWKYQNC